MFVLFYCNRRNVDTKDIQWKELKDKGVDRPLSLQHTSGCHILTLSTSSPVNLVTAIGGIEWFQTLFHRSKRSSSLYIIRHEPLNHAPVQTIDPNNSSSSIPRAPVVPPQKV